MRVRSGYLPTRVTIQQSVAGQDELGQPSNRWEDVAVVWANIADISGREFIASAAVQNTVQTKITLRYRAGVLPAMRVVHQARIYNIEAVLQQDRVSLLLMCSKGTN
jgi:SPP1 family predicted phage head-tail adaptor